MKDKIIILSNLLQKLAILTTRIKEPIHLFDHIIMLDWVLSKYDYVRSIQEIKRDPDYKLSPKEYFEKHK